MGTGSGSNTPGNQISLGKLLIIITVYKKVFRVKGIGCLNYLS
jgi:hypothetical protein